MQKEQAAEDFAAQNETTSGTCRCCGNIDVPGKAWDYFLGHSYEQGGFVSNRIHTTKLLDSGRCFICSDCLREYLVDGSVAKGKSLDSRKLYFRLGCGMWVFLFVGFLAVLDRTLPRWLDSIGIGGSELTVAFIVIAGLGSLAIAAAMINEGGSDADNAQILAGLTIRFERYGRRSGYSVWTKKQYRDMFG